MKQGIHLNDMKQYLQKTFFIVLIFLGATSFIYGQDETVSELSRQYAIGQWHVRLKKAEGENKTEYLFNPGYLLANFQAPDSKEIIKDKRFRLNLRTSKLFFQNENNEEMEVVSPIKKIEFIPQEGNTSTVIFERGFSPADKFYQVLVSGKASLLLDTKFVEGKDFAYGGTAETHIDKETEYYGASGTTTVKLSKTEAILQLMTDKTQEITDYIKKEKIKVKNTDDLVKVFTYYNSIAK